MNGRAWSDDEDRAILDLSRTPAELARELGRSPASVWSRRSRLRRAEREPGRDVTGVMRVPKGAPRSWLIAKSCRRCLLLLPRSEFGERPEGGWASICRRCNSAQVSDRRADAEYRAQFDARTRGNQHAKQREAVEAARNHRKEWTGPELELVMRDDLTDREKAEKLGRTFYAVRHIIRRINRSDPVKVHLAGLSKGA